MNSKSPTKATESRFRMINARLLMAAALGVSASAASADSAMHIKFRNCSGSADNIEVYVYPAHELQNSVQNSSAEVVKGGEEGLSCASSSSCAVWLKLKDAGEASALNTETTENYGHKNMYVFVETSGKIKYGHNSDICTKYSN